MANETKPRVIQVVDAEGPQLRITALVGKEPVHPVAFRQEQPAGLAVRQGQGQRIDQLVRSVLIQPQMPNLLRKGLESGIFRQEGTANRQRKSDTRMAICRRFIGIFLPRSGFYTINE